MVKKLGCPNCKVSFISSKQGPRIPAVGEAETLLPRSEEREDHGLSAWGSIFKIRTGPFNIFFCKECQNGFTYPVPANLGKYYQKDYWRSLSFFGIMRSFAYRFFQKRRLRWVRTFKSSGKILDIGAGEGNFGRSLAGQYEVVSIDAPFAKLKNKGILKTDFLNWKTSQKFDLIVFWESLEHVLEPQKFLEKAFKLLKKDGLILIEYPRFGCFESRLFGKFWYHLDLPRHVSHLTDDGLKNLLVRIGYLQIERKAVWAGEYALIGFMASFLGIFKVSLTGLLGLLDRNMLLLPFFGLVLGPLLAVSVVFEFIFLLFGQSPIGLMIARKT